MTDNPNIIKEALEAARTRIDVHMGDTDPADLTDPDLLAMQSIDAALALIEKSEEMWEYPNFDERTKDVRHFAPFNMWSHFGKFLVIPLEQSE